MGRFYLVKYGSMSLTKHPGNKVEGQATAQGKVRDYKDQQQDDRNVDLTTKFRDRGRSPRLCVQTSPTVCKQY